MENKDIEVFKGYLEQTKGEVPSVLGRLLQGLPEKDLAQLRLAALEGKLSIELEQQRMANRYLASQAEMREFIAAVKEYEGMSNPLTSLSGLRDQREINTATGTTTVSYRRGCFVASFVYANPAHPDVLTLKKFRRRVLERFTLGRKASAWYYAHGEELVGTVSRLGLKTTVRAFLQLLCKALRAFDSAHR
jgi:hypothetical protein